MNIDTNINLMIATKLLYETAYPLPQSKRASLALWDSGWIGRSKEWKSNYMQHATYLYFKQIMKALFEHKGVEIINQNRINKRFSYLDTGFVFDPAIDKKLDNQQRTILGYLASPYL